MSAKNKQCQWFVVILWHINHHHHHHRTISTDIPDPFSPPFSIVHFFRQVFRTTSRILTELLYVGSSWSSCLCSAMWRGPQEYITYELVPTSPAVSCMSGSSNLDSSRDWPYNCCFAECCFQDFKYIPFVNLFVITFLNKPEHISSLHTVKWVQAFLSNGIILFSINYLFAHS